MLKQNELCGLAQRELESAAETMQSLQDLTALIENAALNNDLNQAHTLAKVGSSLLAYASERAFYQAEFFYSGGRDE